MSSDLKLGVWGCKPGPRTLLALLFSSLLLGCASLPRPEPVSLSTPQGPQPLARLQLGQGPGPTVVMQSGLGDSHEVWADLVPLLTPRHPVFLYDRPGYGASPRLAGSRDPCTVARELYALLRQSGAQPPYLLLGHSLGGLYQHAFARLYPREVAGLILLEPTHPEHWASMQRETPGMVATVRTLRSLVFSEAMRQEFDTHADCLAELPPLANPPPPALLMARTDWPLIEQGAFAAMVTRLWEDWRRLAAVQRVERLPGDEHYLQRRHPQAVAAAVDRLVAAHCPRPQGEPGQRRCAPGP